jgi:hypothetical protein
MTPCNNITEHDFCPLDFVNLKEKPDRIGVVQSVNTIDRTLNVKWLGSESVNEEMSIYEVCDNEMHGFRLMQTVVRLPST